jgi:hypothetical protein
LTGSSWGIPGGWLASKGAGGSGATITVPGSEGRELGGWDGEEWEIGGSGETGGGGHVTGRVGVLFEGTDVSSEGGSGGVLHGVDLPVSAGDTWGSGGGTGAEGEGWGPGVGAGSPGALLVHGEGRGGGDLDDDGGAGESSGEDAGDGGGGGLTAEGGLLWATDSGELSALVAATEEKLGSVHDTGSG